MNAIFILLTLGISGNQISLNCNQISSARKDLGQQYTVVLLTSGLGHEVRETPEFITNKCNQR